MVTYNVLAGSADVSVVIRIIDATDGTPETGVVFNTSGIDLQYRRELAASTAITEATLAALTTAHADGGFLHIGNGYYRLDLPDAAVAAGASGCLVHGTVTGMIVIGCYINLSPVPVDVRQWLGTAAATPTVAGVPEVDLTHIAGSVVSTSTAQLGVNAVQAGGTAWGSGAITAASIATGAIDADAIADNAIDAGALAADCITNAKIADAALGPENFSATALARMGVIGAGTAQSASATGVVLASADAYADNVLIGMTILVFGSTQGYWQSRIITDNALTGDAVTVDTWTVTPTGTITYIILATPPGSTSAPVPASLDATQLAKFFTVDSGTTYASAVAGSVVKETADNAGGSALTVQAIVDGVWNEDATGHQTQGTFGQTVGDAAAGASLITRVADILTDTAEIGTAGAGLTNINLPNQTMDIVGNITGNLSGSVGSVTGAVGSVTAGVTLADGAQGGSAAVLTLRRLVVATSAAGETAVDISASGTGNAHALNVLATGGGKGIAVGAASNGISVNSSAADAIAIQGGTDSDGLQVAGNGTGVDIRGNITGALSGAVGDVTAELDVNVAKIAGAAVQGAGVTADKWRPV